VAETNRPFFWWCVTVLRPRIDPAFAVFLLARRPFHETLQPDRVKFGRQLRTFSFFWIRPASASRLAFGDLSKLCVSVATPLNAVTRVARPRLAMQFPAQAQPQTKPAQRDPYSTVSSLDPIHSPPLPPPPAPSTFLHYPTF
jgi:hypothetical protein